VEEKKSAYKKDFIEEISKKKKIPAT